MMPRYAARPWPSATLDRSARTGLVLLGMGGPDGPAAVAPFLRNLFADPAVLPLPRWLAPLVGRLIVRRRIAAVRDRYGRVGFGGGSPQLDWTRKQGSVLAESLGEHGLHAVPGCAMRYWHPFPDECVSDLMGRGAEQLLVVPTYPQYATATTGSALGAFCTVAARLAPHLPIHVVPEWHRLEGYLEALVKRAAVPLRRWAEAGAAPEECALIYTAHSLPERFERGGDPYVAQSRATVAAVHQRLRGHLAAWSEWLAAVAGGREAILAFQSKVGPVRWVGPELETAALALVRGGARRLAVVPVSFTCEHIETVYELDQELTAALRAAGASEVHRAPALNLDPEWLASLAALLRRRAFGAGLATTEAAPREQR